MHNSEQVGFTVTDYPIICTLSLPGMVCIAWCFTTAQVTVGTTLPTVCVSVAELLQFVTGEYACMYGVYSTLHLVYISIGGFIHLICISNLCAFVKCVCMYLCAVQAYVQSPEQMKGLLAGLFYLVFGLFSDSASLSSSTIPSLTTYLILCGIFTIVLLVVIVVCLYSNRD